MKEELIAPCGIEKKEDAPAVVAMILTNRLLILNASLKTVK